MKLNNQINRLVALILILLLPVNSAFADNKPVKVNALNYVEAKSAFHFDRVIAKGGGLNKWVHIRTPVPIDQQRVSRMNRDTLYSSIVVDLSAGATLSIPESNGRYLSATVINQGHYINNIFHKAGEYSLTVSDYDTNFVLITVRILVNANQADDILKVNNLQNKLSLKSNSSKTYSHQNFDIDSLKETGKGLTKLADSIPDATFAYGKKENVNPVKHLLVTAYGWGGLPESEAFYVNSNSNLENRAYSLTVKDVPVNGFWSISVYNKKGFFEKNEYDAYSVNNLTAKQNSDQSITVHFGGNPSNPNFLPITDGWSYVVRMYQPSEEIIEGKWVFPDIEAL